MGGIAIISEAKAATSDEVFGGNPRSDTHPSIDVFDVIEGEGVSGEQIAVKHA